MIHVTSPHTFTGLQAAGNFSRQSKPHQLGGTFFSKAGVLIVNPFQFTSLFHSDLEGGNYLSFLYAGRRNNILVVEAGC